MRRQRAKACQMLGDVPSIPRPNGIQAAARAAIRAQAGRTPDGTARLRGAHTIMIILHPTPVVNQNRRKGRVKLQQGGRMQRKALRSGTENAMIRLCKMGKKV